MPDQHSERIVEAKSLLAMRRAAAVALKSIEQMISQTPVADIPHQVLLSRQRLDVKHCLASIEGALLDWLQQMPDSSMDKILFMFDIADKNRDGCLCATELSQVLAQLNDVNVVSLQVQCIVKTALQNLSSSEATTSRTRGLNVAGFKDLVDNLAHSMDLSQNGFAELFVTQNIFKVCGRGILEDMVYCARQQQQTTSKEHDFSDIVILARLQCVFEMMDHHETGLVMLQDIARTVFPILTTMDSLDSRQLFLMAKEKDKEEHHHSSLVNFQQFLSLMHAVLALSNPSACKGNNNSIRCWGGNRYHYLANEITATLWSRRVSCDKDLSQFYIDVPEAKDNSNEGNKCLIQDTLLTAKCNAFFDALVERSAAQQQQHAGLLCLRRLSNALVDFFKAHHDIDNDDAQESSEISKVLKMIETILGIPPPQETDNNCGDGEVITLVSYNYHFLDVQDFKIVINKVIGSVSNCCDFQELINFIHVHVLLHDNETKQCAFVETFSRLFTKQTIAMNHHHQRQDEQSLSSCNRSTNNNPASSSFRILHAITGR